MSHHPVVEILSIKMCVSGSELDFEDAHLDSQYGNIEGASIHEDQRSALLFFLSRPYTLGNGSRNRLVNT